MRSDKSLSPFDKIRAYNVHSTRARCESKCSRADASSFPSQYTSFGNIIPVDPPLEGTVRLLSELYHSRKDGFYCLYPNFAGSFSFMDSIIHPINFGLIVLEKLRAPQFERRSYQLIVHGETLRSHSQEHGEFRVWAEQGVGRRA